jgi:hypothetical protein
MTALGNFRQIHLLFVTDNLALKWMFLPQVSVVCDGPTRQHVIASALCWSNISDLAFG